MAMRNLGILVRMILYKKERRNMWLRICIIVLCSLLIPIVLIFAILSALGGGFGDSTRQYLDGINRAGEDSEMVFSEMKAFPSMPAGFVTIFADYPPVDGLNMYPIEGTEIITEIYFENGKLLQEDIISRRNGMNGTAAYTYICEEKQTIVVLTNSHVIPLCSETYLFGKIKSAILDIQKKDSWSEQDDSDFWGKYGILPPEKETDPSLGRFIFNETRDPDSSFSSVDKTWSARLVGSLYEESTKDFPDTMVDIYYPVSPEGNRVPRETLPEGVWTVYSLPCRYLWRTEEYMERERELIKGDLSYLLNHWRNASDIR